ncbi:MAG: energy transducer TonB [Sphingomonas taxi]
MLFFDDDPRRRSITPNRDLDPTYARPQPWFVGNGKGLMIFIVSLVAILSAVRVYSAVWMAEVAWAWWHHTDDRKISYNPADWITADDYPMEALRQDQQGIVRIAWRVSADGHVSECWTMETSGFALLDQAACRAILRSGRYPAVAGSTAPRVFSRRVIWKIPE